MVKVRLCSVLTTEINDFYMDYDMDWLYEYQCSIPNSLNICLAS